VNQTGGAISSALSSLISPEEIAMSNQVSRTTAVLVVFLVVIFGAVISWSDPKAASRDERYMPQYNAAGEMILPPNNMWREWVYVGSPLTPNALNGGKAGFPEYHNVYIQPWAYEEYKKTNQFPEGTIMFKELQLTLGPAQNPDGSQTEPSGRGYFPGAYNGADVSVKDSKRFADTGGWGYFDFNHFEPKLASTKVQPRTQCAFCHIGNAKKDQVWTQFYRLLDQ
jgi:hypothetical protein